VDSNNDNDNPNYSKVLNMSEYLWCPDEMCIVRQGVTGYGKQAAADYMTKLRTFGPLIRQIVKGYLDLPNEVKAHVEFVPTGGVPRQLEGPHVNKLGVYYSMFIARISDLISVFSLPEPHRWAAAMATICTRAAHKPIIFYNVIGEVMTNPCCFDGKHISSHDPLEFFWFLYNKMFGERENSNQTESMALRMQPFHNSQQPYDKTKPGSCHRHSGTIGCSDETRDEVSAPGSHGRLLPPASLCVADGTCT
jgi:hypothetical protein